MFHFAVPGLPHMPQPQSDSDKDERWWTQTHLKVITIDLHESDWLLP